MDAPWIRDAELNGYPEGDDVYCPVCGHENPERFYITDNYVIGCTECVKEVDPWDWTQEQEDC